MHDEAAARAETQQRLRHQRAQLGAGDADQLVRRAGGIGQRAEDIEDGADADPASDRRDVAHRRVVALREEEAEADLADAGRGLRGAERDRAAQRFEHIGAAAAGGHRAVAVLGDGHAAAGQHERRGGAGVERPPSVASRAGSVGKTGQLGELDRQRMLAHRSRQPDHLIDRFALDPQRREQRRRLERVGAAGHQRVHRRARFGVGQIAPLVNQGAQRRRQVAFSWHGPPRFA